MDSFNLKEINYIIDHFTEFTADWYLRPPQECDIRWKQVLPQMEARKKASEKLPDWTSNPALLFPKRLSIEQCSSQKTAQWKQAWIKQQIPEDQRTLLTDLSGGFGVDCWHMAQVFKQAQYVEQDPELCGIAGHNFNHLGGTPIAIFSQEAETFLSHSTKIGGVAFIDPARRNERQQKLVALSDCSPDLVELMPLLKHHFDYVMLKLSPMLDVQAALKDLPDCRCLEVWAVQKECKELIVLLDFTKAPPSEVPITARQEGYADFSFTREQERQVLCPLATHLETYIYEPNVAILKAGAFQSVGSRNNIHKLHINSHLYTSEQLHPAFPGRIFRFIKDFGFKPKEVKAALMGLDACELTVRNFPLKAPELRKKLNLKDGGKHTLFATTLASGEHRLLLCEKI